mmetsp:Transcript_9547/g.29052  ORF Transcript_9547/g.29052 Transcript_9547/m.29052 type:complete len:228 (-) Transcript_9547:3611-4294(-)
MKLAGLPSTGRHFTATHPPSWRFSTGGRGSRPIPRMVAPPCTLRQPKTTPPSSRHSWTGGLRSMQRTTMGTLRWCWRRAGAGRLRSRSSWRRAPSCSRWTRMAGPHSTGRHTTATHPPSQSSSTGGHRSRPKIRMCARVLRNACAQATRPSHRSLNRTSRLLTRWSAVGHSADACGGPGYSGRGQEADGDGRRSARQEQGWSHGPARRGTQRPHTHRRGAACEGGRG